MEIDTSVRSPNQERRRKPIDMLVLHATAGSAVSALGWLCNPAAKVSAHYLISKPAHVWQLVPEDQVAWHAGQSSWQGRGDCNAYSIGIELENANTGKDPYPAVQYLTLLALCHDIVTRYAIPRDRVVRHMDIAPGRKNDPAGFPWAQFLADLYPATPAAAHYRVRAYCYVRAAPDTAAARTGDLMKGAEVQAAIVEGGFHKNAWGQGSLWAHLTTGGYVWLPQLEAL